MVISVALAVCHVKTVDCPCWITSGLAVRVAVGAVGGGAIGAGWVTFAAFLALQATKKIMTASGRIRADEFNIRIIIGMSPDEERSGALQSKFGFGVSRGRRCKPGNRSTLSL